MSELDLSAAALQELRAGLNAWAAMVAAREPVEQVEDEAFVFGPQVVAARRYRPTDGQDLVLVWFHGGGYVAGTLDAIDPVCRRLANQARVTVLSVDYRLAPEHPFPAGLEDAHRVPLAVSATVTATSRTGRVAIGGDSAGAGLATAVALQTAVPLAALVLLCPWLDLTLSSPSVSLLGQSGLTEASLRSFARAYAAGTPLDDPRLSPLLSDQLHALPPTVVVSAGKDPLRDEADRFAALVEAAGVEVRQRQWPDQEHGFVGQTADNAAALAALDWAAAELVRISR